MKYLKRTNAYKPQVITPYMMKERIWFLMPSMFSVTKGVNTAVNTKQTIPCFPKEEIKFFKPSPIVFFKHI